MHRFSTRCPDFDSALCLDPGQAFPLLAISCAHGRVMNFALESPGVRSRSLHTPTNIQLTAMLSLFARNKPVQRLDDLKKLFLFVDLNTREMKIVDGFLHERSYLKDEVVFDEGEEGQAIYFILAGKVLICRQGESDRPIAILERGNFFGELALLDDAPRSAQARAAGNCTLAVFFRGDFLSLMQSHALIASKIALQLARHLGVRLRGTVHNGQEFDKQWDS